MFQAQQKAVVQQANINLVNIRYMEIKYFTDFFSNFGTQCFILAGLICGSISQTPQLDDVPCPYFFVILYNSMATSCVALATLGMLASVFIAVYGEGLAIRGPLGSLVKTIDGMVQEQHQAVFLFVAAVVTFDLQLVGMCWIMMDNENAIACTIVLLGWSLYTYRIALRIYNRFWWDKTKSDWNEEVNRVLELDELAPTVNELYDEYGQNKVDQAYRISLHRGYLTSNDSELKKRSVLRNMLKNWYKASKKTLTGNRNSTASASSLTAANTSKLPSQPVKDVYFDGASVVSDTPYMEVTEGASNTPNIVHFAGNMNSDNASTTTTASQITDFKAAGYLTLKRKESGFGLFSHPWERRYFIVKKTLLYYYQDKNSFELEPSKPLNQRAIDLEGYSLHATCTEPPYVLSLIPIEEGDIRTNWVFRADTLAEYDSWKEIFSTALEAANVKRSKDSVDVRTSRGTSVKSVKI
jgi:hypothetical protein